MTKFWSTAAGLSERGPPLLIARINILHSVLDTYHGHFVERPDHSTAMRPFALGIARNLIQVDMLRAPCHPSRPTAGIPMHLAATERGPFRHPTGDG